MALDDELTELVARSGQRLLQVAYQLTHDRAAAQDLVQDALLHVYRSARRRGHAPQDWYAYLRRAVVNEHLRTRRLGVRAEIATSSVPEPPVAPAAAVQDQLADREEMWSALGALSARQRAVLVLRYYECLPDREIAAVLGCREASVRSLASRGLGVLRRQADQVTVTEEDRS
jgi:RNA polymerase sigma-70 factor (sigma-E family)